MKSDIVPTKTSTINLFGFETLKLKIRRLKLWKPTVVIVLIIIKTMIITMITMLTLMIQAILLII